MKNKFEPGDLVYDCELDQLGIIMPVWPWSSEYRIYMPVPETTYTTVMTTYADPNLVIISKGEFK